MCVLVSRPLQPQTGIPFMLARTRFARSLARTHQLLSLGSCGADFFLALVLKPLLSLSAASTCLAVGAALGVLLTELAPSSAFLPKAFPEIQLSALDPW